jgi:adenosyl cobinamide kinase/adenosyl cobinamide phosphate guanylyltransferase
LFVVSEDAMSAHTTKQKNQVEHPVVNVATNDSVLERKARRITANYDRKPGPVNSWATLNNILNSKTFAAHLPEQTMQVLPNGV